MVTGTLMAGQIAGLIRSEESCRDIVQGIVRECNEVIGEYR